MKYEVGVAKNAAPAPLLCSKTTKILVYFCSFYISANNEQKAQTAGFEHYNLGLVEKHSENTRKTHKILIEQLTLHGEYDTI